MDYFLNSFLSDMFDNLTFDNMYQKRLKAYRELGYQLKTGFEQLGDGQVLYDTTDFLPILQQDLLNANLSITISSPVLQKSRTAPQIDFLSSLSVESEQIRIITRSFADLKPAALEGAKELVQQLRLAKFNVSLKENHHQKFIVIDEQVVWYGNINFFGYGKKIEPIMRFVNREIAEELLGILGS